ncbi:MAG: TolC family protein, partial [Myxococcales bacterium]|nr:TolC family protein [Myxococcales bacterium]
MSRERLAYSVGALLLAFAVPGCVPSLSQNKPREANREVPAAFANGKGGSKANSARRKWDEFFADPHLKALIETALKNNQELNIRMQEVLIAKNEVMARKGEYLPKVDAQAGAGLEKVGKHTSQGAADEATGVPEHLANYKFGFSASWEVDVWGKLRNAAKAAAYRYLSSVEGRNLVVTGLVAEISNSYYELLALDNQLDVLLRNIEIQRNAL